MKKIAAYLALLACTVVGSLVWGALSVSVQLHIESLVDVYLDTFISTQYSEEDLSTLITKIQDYQEDTTLNEQTHFGLEYIQQQLMQLSPTDLQPITTGDNNTGTSIDSGAVIDLATYVDEDRSVVAGKESPVIMEIAFTAQLEPVLIQDLLINSSDNLGELLETISIYNESGALVYTFSPTNNSALIEGINLTIPKGTSYFYLTVTPHPIGQYQLGPQFADITLSVSVSQAVGQITNDTINNYGSIQTSNLIQIQPVRIADISFVSSGYGYKIPQRLVPGDNNLAILKVTADNRANTRSDSSKELGLLLDTLTLTIQDGTQAQDISDNLSLKRIDSGGDRIVGNGIGSETTTFDFTSSSLSTQRLESGESAYFLIRGDISLNNAITEFGGVSINQIDDGAIRYQSDDSAAVMIDKLLLNIDQLSADTIFSR